MKKCSKIEDLPIDILLKLNILIEEIRCNSELNKAKNWYRFRFSNIITIYEINKLFLLAEKFGYIQTLNRVEEKIKEDGNFILKAQWICKYVKSLEKHLLPKENYQRHFLPTNKKDLKIKLIKDCIEKNPHFTIKKISNDLKISERTVHNYFNLIKKQNPNIKKIPNLKNKPTSYYQKLSKSLNEIAWLLNDLDINNQIKEEKWIIKVREMKNKFLKINL